MNFQKHHPVRALLNEHSSGRIQNYLALGPRVKKPKSRRWLAKILGTFSKPKLAQLTAQLNQ